MQRWYTQPEETTTRVPLPPQPQRHMPETVPQAAEIAATIPVQQQQETLPVTEIDAIANELGIEPQFVREALRKMEAEAIAPQQQVTVATKKRRMSRRRKALIFGLPLLTFLFGTVFWTAIFFLYKHTNTPSPDWALWLWFLLLPLLTIVSAVSLKRIRQSLIAGALYGLVVFGSAFAAAFLYSLISHSPMEIGSSAWKETLYAFAGSTVTGGLLGVVSAGTAKLIRQWRKGKIPHWLDASAD